MSEVIQRKTGVNHPAYKWLVLVLFSLVMYVVSFCQFQPAFFAQDIMADLNIDTSAYAIITSGPMIASFVVALFGGSLADKYGIKKVVLVGLAISSVGAVGRFFCGDFLTLTLMSMLMGVSAAIATANTAKLAIGWFKPSQISLVVGISLAIGVFGIASAQAFTGILFPDYHSAFLGGGIATVVLTVLWAIFGRDRVIAPDMGEEAQSLRASIAEVARSRNIWFAGIGTMLFTGFNVAFSGFLTTALIVVWGTEPVVAGLIASMATIGAAIGATFVPAVVSRMRPAKLVCIAMPIFTAAMILVGWNIDVVAVRIVCFMLAGICYGSFNPLFMLYPSILPEIRPQVAGTAGGLITMIMMAGSIVVPSCIVTPIAGDNYWLIVVVCAIVVGCVAIWFALLPSVNGRSVAGAAADAGAQLAGAPAGEATEEERSLSEDWNETA